MNNADPPGKVTGHKIDMIQIYSDDKWSPWCVTCMQWLTGTDAGMSYGRATRETMAHILTTLPPGESNARSVRVAYDLLLGPEDMAWAGTYAPQYLLDDSLAYLYRIILDMVESWQEYQGTRATINEVMYLFNNAINATDTQINGMGPSARQAATKNIRTLINKGEWDLGIVKEAIRDMLS